MGVAGGDRTGAGDPERNPGAPGGLPCFYHLHLVFQKPPLPVSKLGRVAAQNEQRGEARPDGSTPHEIHLCTGAILQTRDWGQEMLSSCQAAGAQGFPIRTSYMGDKLTW